MLIDLINICLVLLTVLLIFPIWKKRRNVAFFCLILFDVAYVIPLLVEFFLGKPKFSSAYVGFVLSANDEATAFAYAFFILVVETCFFVYLNRSHDVSPEISDIALNIQERFCKNPLLIFFSIIIVLSPIVAIMLAPNMQLYLSDFGKLGMDQSDLSLVDIVYHKKIASKFVTLAAFGVILLKIIDKKNFPAYKFLRVVGIILVALVNGKRTFVTFLVIFLVIMDFLLKKKKKYLRFNIAVSVVCVIVYFVAYSYISGKYEYNTDWYAVISEYFFRNNSVKVAIYSALNPEKLPILDYPGQTLLFDFLFFVPRSIWPTKPYPFPDYYTSAIFGFSTLTSIGWNFQTNIYAEWIANLGFFGFFITPVVLVIFCRIVNKSSGVVEYVLGAGFILLMHVFEFSDMLKVMLMVWLTLLLSRKFKMKKRKKV